MKTILENLKKDLSKDIRVRNYLDIALGDSVHFNVDFPQWKISQGDIRFARCLNDDILTVTKLSKSRKIKNSLDISVNELSKYLNNDSILIYREKVQKIDKNFIKNFLGISGILYILSKKSYNVMSAISQSSSYVYINYTQNPKFHNVIKNRITYAFDFMGINYEILHNAIAIPRNQVR